MTQRHWVQNERLMHVTTVTKDREPIFQDDAKALIACDTIYQTQDRYPFFLHGFVVMPDHCHVLLRVPFPGSISRIIHAYKRGVVFRISEGPLWQPRFDCRFVDEPLEILEYIHRNPVEGELCQNPEEYPWSSANARWNIIHLDEYGAFL